MVNYTEGDGKMVVMDIGAPVSLVGRDWVERYLRENELGWEKMKTYECKHPFKFGPSKKCVSKEK